MKLLVALIVLAGCVEEYDPSVWVTLPQSCAVLDAARLVVDVRTRDGEEFAITTTGCESRLAGQDVAGFHAPLERLTYGYHRLDARLEGSDGTTLGTLSRPFAASAATYVAFARADLPGWPRVHLALDVAACTAGDVVDLEIVGSVADDPRPVTSTVLPCSPAPLAIDVPRGPLALLVVAHHRDGACSSTSSELFAVDGATVPLALGTPGECP